MDTACAQACAKNGNTVALVTEKGDVYEVMAMGALAGREKRQARASHVRTRSR
jgi:hypothetical protein